MLNQSGNSAGIGKGRDPFCFLFLFREGNNSSEPDVNKILFFEIDGFLNEGGNTLHTPLNTFIIHRDLFGTENSFHG